LSDDQRSKRPMQRFQVWMVVAVLVAAAAFAVAVIGPSKVLCTVEGGRYSASSGTCFIPKGR
jgi:hypothetical protein